MLFIIIGTRLNHYKKNAIMIYTTEVDVDIDIEDIVDDTDDETLVSELESRGYSVSKEKINQSRSITYLSGYDIKELLQDMFDLNHHTDTETIIQTIKQYI